ncbi:MAG: sugar porter family MFS transporter [Patescibacteria group bacterium]|nr:sugar porter family MFS transporter [Patescibacteria group bacterium]
METLQWDITPQEAKSRTLQSIPVVANVLAGLALILAIKEKSWRIFFIFAGIVIAFYIFTLVFAKFKPRKFQISQSGITISKGTKQKTYSWDEFDCFYTHSLVINRNTKGVRNFRTHAAVQDIITTNDRLVEISGNTYYLKKKKRTFWDKIVKTFVVVYSEPDNSGQVEQAISTYLSHQPLEMSTEAGMIKYEFK